MRAPGVDQRVERAQARLAVVAQAARVVEPDARRAAGTAARISSSLSTCSWSSTMAKRDLGVVDREDELGGRPRPGTAAPGSRRATAPRASSRTGAAGSRRSTTMCSPRLQARPRRRPQASARTSSASARQLERLPDAEFLLAQRRRVGPRARRARAAVAGRWSARVADGARAMRRAQPGGDLRRL